MGIKVFDLDIHNLPLTDFMRAMGYEPTEREGNHLTYDSPYSTGGNIIVDTEKNVWYDSKEPEKCYGGIYDLAYEITGWIPKRTSGMTVRSRRNVMAGFTTSPMRLPAVATARN